ncbi:MAG: hypothetical protein IT381_11005 [Deltaproteobacteria bacterium]|nr:hypothetical protein [Deltaproteobacteria bacterium]
MITQDELAVLAKAEEASLDAVQVDDFALDEFLRWQQPATPPESRSARPTAAEASRSIPAS